MTAAQYLVLSDRPRDGVINARVPLVGFRLLLRLVPSTQEAPAGSSPGGGFVFLRTANETSRRDDRCSRRLTERVHGKTWQPRKRTP